MRRLRLASRPLAHRIAPRRFLVAREGNVAVFFALASLPLLAFAGAAIDYGTATRTHAKLQAATDATALSLCQSASTTTTAQMQIQAQTMMAGYMGADGLTVDPLVVTANPRKVLLTTHMSSPALFGQITKTLDLNPAAFAQCATPMPKTFEIALVLDTTGSMGSSAGTTTKMQAAQQAAANFIDYVHNNPAFTAETRISIVPFAAAVAVDPATYRTATWIDQLGKSSYHWTNVTGATAAGFTSRFGIFDSLKSVSSNWGWAGCLETLPYPLNVQDGKPGASADSLYVPMFAPDEPGSGNTTYTTYGGNYSFNSYLNDSTGSNSCKADPSLSFAAAEARACKYTSPQGAASTTYNSYIGLPNGPNFACTSQPLQRLTSDVTVLKTLVGTLKPQGATNILEGLMWGWRTLSPNSVFADGVAYSTANVNKIIILMTDGANSWSDNPYTNYNQTLFFSMGYFKNADGSTPNGRLPAAYQNLSNTTQARGALDALTQAACGNAKSTGIQLYTIGFSTSGDPIDAQGLTLLNACASSQSQAFVANTSDALIAAFDQIAKSIGTLRLTQ
ncbi:TadE/TadG family type IV pilus assembly protein [Methylobacterium sp. J-068]|uniref:TadE/TadG family type IV pilus assembly protein n=1 Tax=Methylobacterium sp. J-068 TaxID=2836649 RepID=UPI001FBA4276|nr:pilus assembly protein [Methylobacterium sp. J-068]MCJ2032953.1 pilus assembly protein [Methylobacterium sp. J-068]